MTRRRTATAMVLAAMIVSHGCGPAEGEKSQSSPATATERPATSTKVSLPPLRFERADDGSRRAVINHSAFVAWCRAYRLPDPPDVGDVDAAAMGSIHARANAVAKERTDDALLALAIAYDGNSVLESAEPLYRELAERDPNRFEYVALHGRVLAKLDRPTEAVTQLERAVSIRPNEAAVHYRLGDAAFATGDLDRAATAFTRAKELRPSDGLGAYGLARIAARRESWEESRDALEEAVRTAPELRSAWLLLAQMRQRTGDRAGATEAASRADAIPDQGYVSIVDPLETQMYRTSGSTAALEADVKALADAGKFADAYSAAIRLADRRPQDALIRRNLVNIARQLRRFDDAITHVDRLIAIDPGDGSSHQLRSTVFRDLNRWDASLTSADAALAADRPDARAHLLRATALTQLRRIDEALIATEAAERALPESIDPLILRAGILYAVKRFDAAVPVLERILAIDPNHTWSKEKLAELKTPTP